MKLPTKKIRAKVIRGAGRGKRLGIPTINLEPSASGNLREGIWVCRALLPAAYWGLLHFGPRPVFNEEEKTCEVHLFDFEDLPVPSHLDLEIFDFLREVMDFENPQKLIEQIEEDIILAKRRIKKFKY